MQPDKDAWRLAQWCLLENQNHGIRLLVITIHLYFQQIGSVLSVLMMQGVYNPCRIEQLVERAKTLKVNAGTEPDADLGPVISKQVGKSNNVNTAICRTKCVQIGIFQVLVCPVNQAPF